MLLHDRLNNQLTLLNINDNEVVNYDCGRSELKKIRGKDPEGKKMKLKKMKESKDGIKM